MFEGGKFISLLLFIFAMYASPGPATISLASSGATVGFRKSVPYLLGLVLGLLVNFIIVLIGLETLILKNSLVFNLFKYVSFAYILYLAFKIYNTNLDESENKKSLNFHDGLILNTINPKAYIGASAVIINFLAPSSVVFDKSFLIITMFIMGLLIDTAWCYFGQMLIKIEFVTKWRKLINTFFSILLVFSSAYAMFFTG